MSIKHESSHPRTRAITVKKYIASAAIVGAAVAGLASVVLATPGSNIVGTSMARAGFADTVDIKLKLRDEREVIHVAQAADTVMQQIIIGPGGHTGWHSHPGPAIALVKNGELTLYSSEDPTCTGRSFGRRAGICRRGQGHVHIARKSDEPDNPSIALTPNNCVSRKRVRPKASRIRSTMPMPVRASAWLATRWRRRPRSAPRATRIAISGVRRSERRTPARAR